MAVRCDAYQQQGGMNRRQAGEDFYFLHKFIPLGGFAEITATTVVPSPRPSHRVPFGTGRAVGEILRNGGQCATYSPRSFEDLRAFLQFDFCEETNVERLCGRLPESIRSFLELQSFGKKLAEIQLNTGTTEAFRKRFWRWFDAFMVMKFVHFARENYHPDVEVAVAASWLAGLLGLPDTVGPTALLKLFRQAELGT
jgi:hypothetical protein